MKTKENRTRQEQKHKQQTVRSDRATLQSRLTMPLPLIYTSNFKHGLHVIKRNCVPV